MRAIDGWILSFLQRFCDVALRLTGLNKFFFQKLSVIASAVLVAATACIDIDVVYACIAALYVLVSFKLVKAIAHDEELFMHDGTIRITKSHVPARRATVLSVAAALSLLMISVGNLDAYLTEGAIVCTVAWTYLAACEPRPQSKSSVRVWYERRLTELNEWLKADSN